MEESRGVDGANLRIGQGIVSFAWAHLVVRKYVSQWLVFEPGYQATREAIKSITLKSGVRLQRRSWVKSPIWISLRPTETSELIRGWFNVSFRAWLKHVTIPSMTMFRADISGCDTSWLLLSLLHAEFASPVTTSTMCCSPRFMNRIMFPMSAFYDFVALHS